MKFDLKNLELNYKKSESNRINDPVLTNYNNKAPNSSWVPHLASCYLTSSVPIQNGITTAEFTLIMFNSRATLT